MTGCTACTRLMHAIISTTFLSVFMMKAVRPMYPVFARALLLVEGSFGNDTSGGADDSKIHLEFEGSGRRYIV